MHETLVLINPLKRIQSHRWRSVLILLAGWEGCRDCDCQFYWAPRISVLVKPGGKYFQGLCKRRCCVAVGTLQLTWITFRNWFAFFIPACCWFRNNLQICLTEHLRYGRFEHPRFRVWLWSRYSWWELGRLPPSRSVMILVSFMKIFSPFNLKVIRCILWSFVALRWKINNGPVMNISLVLLVFFYSLEANT